MIRSSVVVAALLTAMLAAGSALAGTTARNSVDEAARQIQAMQADNLADLRIMAAMPEVTAYFQAAEKDRHRRLESVQAALASHRMGSELCLIDEHGSEHLRAVHGRMAPSSELAHNEVSAPFFAPSIAMAAGQHHISAPYLSPDVEQWVVGYVVPVVPGKAILHFEHPVANIQKALVAPPGSFTLLIDDRGYVLGDSSRTIALAMKGDKTEPASYFGNVLKGGSAIPADVAAALLAAESGDRRATWDGRTWDVAWSHVGSLIVVAAAPAN